MNLVHVVPLSYLLPVSRHKSKPFHPFCRGIY